MSVPADLSRRAPTRVRSCSASSSETAAERLTDDLLLEILPRVPAKSLCRCRCVSKHWRSLIDHPDLRKKLPRTLAGFFYRTTSTNSFPETFRQPHVVLASVQGGLCPLVSTSLAFLPVHWRLDVLDCCNGLLLCRVYGVSTQSGECYVVCNPATERWAALPDSGQGTGNVLMARLGFDPVQSSHFHVFELLNRLDSSPRAGLAGVAVYSSETGGWVCKERSNQLMMLLYHDRHSVFLNSHLYFHAGCYELTYCLATVDTEAETWTNFGVPRRGLFEGLIQCSQGRMHYANFYIGEDIVGVQLAIYVIENYERKEWILKHAVDASVLFGGIDVLFDGDFDWVGIHPECNLIFFTAGRDTTLMCYNMDLRQVKVIRNLQDGKRPYLPYVPLYAELQSLHM